MIKKLQFRFVAVSMSALLLVLVIIILSMNLVNYHDVVREADTLLTILSENDGRFPPEMDNKENFPHHWISPETPYESRYFFVLLNAEDHSLLQVETSRIASVDSSEAVDYAQWVVKQKKEEGFVNVYRYMRYTELDVERIIFLDCRGELESFQSFLIASIVIPLIGFVVVFILVTFFSYQIIRPISESYEKQKRFITDAGHELKTPLTIINADADVLEMEIGENEWIEDIQKQAKRLTDLTNDLIFLTKMEEAQSAMEKIDFSISDVVSESASSFQSLAQTQNKGFTVRVESMLTLKGNERAIEQLVSILLDNALKYSPDKGEVSVSLEKQNKIIRLEVYNTTEAPLPAEDMNVIFERFYRADASRSSQTGGHGIGLSVAKAIVTAHGGKIQAGTQDGHSLMITVTLPAG